MAFGLTALATPFFNGPLEDNTSLASPWGRRYARPMKPGHAALAFVAAAVLAWGIVAWAKRGASHEEVAVSTSQQGATPPSEGPADDRQLATFGAGCFWCVEAVFSQLDGVESVTSGYMGGALASPSYDDVCSGTTGHAEVAQIHYDPKRVSYAELLEVFWKTHDPTTLNRQGADAGTQYRSAVFFHDAEQERLARAYKEKLNASGAFGAPLVTEIVPAGTFWPADAHHQDYYARNPEQGYCRVVIQPKLEKFRKVFGDRLRR